MAVFNCAPFENEDSVELEVTTQTGDQDTGELAVTDSLKIKGVDGVSVSVDDACCAELNDFALGAILQDITKVDT